MSGKYPKPTIIKKKNKTLTMHAHTQDDMILHVYNLMKPFVFILAKNFFSRQPGC